ncbi:very-long-chain enoyl-CoA reductase-like isoform X1 [Scleropages formosus]|uniref:very-long-chain enoyl-CoA reductase-like isoform X1 n=1 Tax=Scleropages formosus TaxID=113540 RepID=UPI0008782BED|nr:very-long-chain enoyl-CoA reductase-like isoform X1 [Scleropages formosus]
MDALALEAKAAKSEPAPAATIPVKRPKSAKKVKKKVVFFEVEIQDAKTKEKLLLLDKVEPNATIAEIKSMFHKAHPQWYPARQSLRLDPKGKSLKDDEILQQLPVGTTATFYFRDLGAQISWVTIFRLVDCAPISWRNTLSMLAQDHLRPTRCFSASMWGLFSSISCSTSECLSSMPPSMTSPLANTGLCTWPVYATLSTTSRGSWRPCLSTASRTAPCHCATSGRTVPITGALLRGWPTTSTTPCIPLPVSPLWILYCRRAERLSTQIYGEQQVKTALIIFLFCQIGNFSIHVALRNLRPPGSKTRKIPYPTRNPFTWIFLVVSCPNYTYEVGAWLAFTVMTQCLPVALFTAVGFIQMTVWARGKHRSYLKEFREYPTIRSPILPFLL